MSIKIHCKYDALVNPNKLKNHDIKPFKIRLKTPVIIEMPGGVVTIDRDCLPLFASYSWYIDKGKGQTSYLKANALVDGKKRTVFFHQLIKGFYHGLEIDHINGNGLDNRTANLRVVTHQQNQSNQRKRKNASSKYFGVSYCSRDKKWQCHSRHNKQNKNIGRFDTEIEAAHAYNNFLIANNIPKALNNV